MDTQRDIIRAKKLIVDTAMIDLDNYIAQNKQKYAEGAAAIARESGRPFAGYAHHYWLDEKVQRFKKEFDWAKRLTYLASRAVEYEFQESLPLAAPILTATHPDQLEDAVRVLQQEQAGRSINRRRPEEQSVVLSVRDDILRITDQTAVQSGFRVWSAAQRFEGRLRDPDDRSATPRELARPRCAFLGRSTRGRRAERRSTRQPVRRALVARDGHDPGRRAEPRAAGQSGLPAQAELVREPVVRGQG